MSQPQKRINDLLQAHRFWLLDISPSTVFPFFVLGSPMYGFASITAPEITLETQEIGQLNSMWKRHAYVGGSCGSITLERGCRIEDDTFYEWVKRAMRGSDRINRTLLLIHYTGSAERDSNGSFVELPNPIDTWDNVSWIPGRVWVLWDCLPVRYKAGSDFDAKSAEVSLMSVELQPHAVEEIVLGPIKVDKSMAVGAGIAVLSKVIGG
jgi:phage tail-like protein